MCYTTLKHVGGGTTILDEKYLTPAEAAKILKVTRNSLYRWVGEGKIKPYVSNTGRKYYTLELLDDFVKGKEPKREI